MLDIKLIEKYSSEEGTVSLEQSKSRFSHQRHRLAEFAHILKTRLGIVIKEMEGDLFVLKERQFDQKVYEMLLKIWNEIIKISKVFHAEKPYTTAEQLINYVNSKNTRNIIDNLNFLAKHHLKQTNIKSNLLPVMGHPQFKSLDLLLNLVEYADKYMLDHPLLSNFEIGSWKYEPLIPVEKSEKPSLTPMEETVPGVPLKKKVI